MKSASLIFGLMLVFTHSACAAVEHHEYDWEIKTCAATVHPETMQALIATESKWHQFAVADAGPKHLPWSKRKALVRSYFFSTQAEAVNKTKKLLSQGHTVSVGLSQLNDRNLDALGLDINQAFDVCLNVAGGAKILTYYYMRAVKVFGETPQALRAALSGYNSGDWTRGEKDGYVDLVYRQSRGSSSSAIQNASLKKMPRKQTAMDQQFTLSVQEFE